MKSTKIYRGTIVYAPQLGALECLEHAYLVAQNGVIAGVFQELPGKYQDTALEDFGDCLLIPSFTDLHLHAPQYAMMGMGFDLPLLEWLNTYTFKEEARFARQTAKREALIAKGKKVEWKIVPKSVIPPEDQINSIVSVLNHVIDKFEADVQSAASEKVRFSDALISWK